jgi:NAD(P)-dependent dehydrogenase (short-subunit alcohol dehydrogenase family)
MKSVLITGTSKGLGYELLKVFLEKGWTVFALARNTKSFSELIEKHSERCFPIECDITEEQCGRKIEETIRTNGASLDLVINNAGNAEKCFGLENVNPSDLDDHFKVHVSGTFRVIKSALPFLNQSVNPLIVNVSSRKGSIHKINTGEYRILIPYQVAKCAQNMLTACLNQELKESNVKVFAVHPGNLKTAVAPPDADTEPDEAAINMYNWLTSADQLPTDAFYDIMNQKELEW